VINFFKAPVTPRRFFILVIWMDFMPFSSMFLFIVFRPMRKNGSFAESDVEVLNSIQTYLSLYTGREAKRRKAT